MTGPVDPAGPIFISHRSTDGTEPAVALARLLRASGLPVWLDKDDLPPGDIITRLTEALDHGLSGAVLIVTPDVGASTVIRDLELPKLLDLAKDPGFTLAILNEVPEPADPTSFDRHAPAALLDPITSHPELHAKPGIKQYSRIDLTAADLGRLFARARLAVLRLGRDAEPLTIDFQTRTMASAYASRADLVFRTAPPPKGRRVPEREVWEDLQRLLEWLADVIGTAKPPQVRLTGGGHLGVGVAIGAGIPEPAGIPLAIETVDGLFRRARHRLSWRERLPVVGVRPRRRLVARGTGTPIAMFVDVAQSEGAGTFVEWVAANVTRFSTATALRRRGHLDPRAAAIVAAAVADEIRAEARRRHTSEVLLFVRSPWPVAVFVGASLNTLTVRIHEWDNSTGTPSYVEVATVRSGVRGSPIIELA